MATIPLTTPVEPGPWARGFQQYALPIMAILEAAYTRGRSPGTAAMGQQQILSQAAERQRQAVADEEARRLRALQRRTGAVTAEKAEEGLAHSRQMRAAQRRLLGLPEEKGAAKSPITKSPLGELSSAEQSMLALTKPTQLGSMIGKIQATRQKTKLKEKELARQKVKDQRELRKEIYGEKSAQNFQEIRDSWSRMNAAWARKDKTKQRGAIDQALIITYNKMLDPGSVVRESEYNRTPEGAALLDRFFGGVQRLAQGGPGITDSFRQEIIDTARTIYRDAEKIYQRSLMPFYNDAKAAKYDLDRIFNPDDLKLMKRGVETEDAKGKGTSTTAAVPEAPKVSIRGITAAMAKEQNIPIYENEQQARAAGATAGDRVFLRGVGIVRLN